MQNQQSSEPNYQKRIRKRHMWEKLNWKLKRLEISQLYDGSDNVLVLRNFRPIQGNTGADTHKAHLDKDVNSVLKLWTSLSMTTQKEAACGEPKLIKMFERKIFWC